MIATLRVQAPGPPDREARAADGRRRLPLPAAAARLRPPVTDAAVAGRRGRAPGRRPALRRRDADRQPRRRHAPGARGPRAPSPLIAAEDTRHDAGGCSTGTGSRRGRSSYHARSGPARERQLLDAPAVAARTSPWSPTPARPASAIRARTWSRAWAGGGRDGRPDPGRLGRRWRPSPGPGSPGRAGRSRGSCRAPGRERRERLARIAADERGTVLYEAPGRVAATLADLAAACGGDRPAAICRELTKLHEEFVRAPLGELADAGTERGADAPRRVRDRRRGGRGGPPARRRRSDGRRRDRGRARRGGPARRRGDRPRRRRPPGRGRDRHPPPAACTGPEP